MHFAIKLTWLLDAEASEDNVSIKLLRDQVETAIINQSLPSYQLKTDLKNSIMKQKRLNYYNDQLLFINFLTCLSERLQAYPIGTIRSIN